MRVVAVLTHERRFVVDLELVVESLRIHRREVRYVVWVVGFCRDVSEGLLVKRTPKVK